MKRSVFFSLLCLVVTAAFGQTAPTTRIYLVKNGSTFSPAIRFYTTLDKSQQIIVRSNAYTVIETDADSLGVLADGPYSMSPPYDGSYETKPAVRKPIFVALEKGKSYYFKVGQVYQNRFFDVSDMSEQAFKLFIGINRIDESPRRYLLSKSGERVSQSP